MGDSLQPGGWQIADTEAWLGKEAEIVPVLLTVRFCCSVEE
jgi:hypothetical protein